jgi:hypothetical protein
MIIVGSALFGGFAGKKESRRADSNRFPLLQHECAVMRHWTLHGLANPA